MDEGGRRASSAVLCERTLELLLAVAAQGGGVNTLVFRRTFGSSTPLLRARHLEAFLISAIAATSPENEIAAPAYPAPRTPLAIHDAIPLAINCTAIAARMRPMTREMRSIPSSLRARARAPAKRIAI